VSDSLLMVESYRSLCIRVDMHHWKAITSSAFASAPRRRILVGVAGASGICGLSCLTYKAIKDSQLAPTRRDIYFSAKHSMASLV
jgi:hypothetical protein